MWIKEEKKLITEFVINISLNWALPWKRIGGHQPRVHTSFWTGRTGRYDKHFPITCLFTVYGLQLRWESGQMKAKNTAAYVFTSAPEFFPY